MNGSANNVMYFKIKIYRYFYIEMCLLWESRFHSVFWRVEINLLMVMWWSKLQLPPSHWHYLHVEHFFISAAHCTYEGQFLTEWKGFPSIPRHWPPLQTVLPQTLLHLATAYSVICRREILPVLNKKHAATEPEVYVHRELKFIGRRTRIFKI